MLPPVRERHARTVNFLRVLIAAFVEGDDVGRVFRMFLMRLHDRPSARLPDLLVVAREHAGRMKETYVDGPADLAVEVVSPERVSRDRGDKYAEYEQAGVREYWLIDPIRESANFYTLDDEGLYRDAPLEEGHIFRSRVLAGLWLDVSWLWQEKLPTMRQTFELVDRMLAEMG
jgi:Uma2 family endonuclease